MNQGKRKVQSSPDQVFKEKQTTYKTFSDINIISSNTKYVFTFPTCKYENNCKDRKRKRTETFVCFDWRTNNTKYVFTFTACKYENCIFFFSEKGNKNYFLTCKTGFLISKDRDFCLFCLLGERLRLIDIAYCQKKRYFGPRLITLKTGYCN